MSKYLHEPERCKQAFDFYYKLGDKRSWYRVAQEFGVAGPTIKSWAEKYDWQARIDEMDLNNGREVLKGTDASLIVELDRNRQIIKKGMTDFLHRLDKGEVKVDKVRDACSLMKLDMEYAQFINQLRHQYDEQNMEVNISFDTKQTIDTLMSQLQTLPSVSDDEDVDGDTAYDNLTDYNVDEDIKVDGTLNDTDSNASFGGVVSV